MCTVGGGRVPLRKALSGVWMHETHAEEVQAYRLDERHEGTQAFIVILVGVLLRASGSGVGSMVFLVLDLFLCF